MIHLLKYFHESEKLSFKTMADEDVKNQIRNYNLM